MEIKFQESIVGKHVILRKVLLSDAQDIYTWRSGYSGRFLRQPKDYSVGVQEEWIKNRNNEEINYIIQNKNTLKSVGMISIYNVDEVDKIAEVGRLLLSDEYLTTSNPFGLESLLLTYDYVFNKMGFRKITGTIASVNQAMIKLQLFLGMKQEGCLQKHTLIADNFEDLHVLSIFKDQFNSVYKSKILFLLKSFSE